MKIAIIGVVGKTSSQIMKECLRHKYHVTAIVRNKLKLENVNKIKILKKIFWC